MHEMEIFERKKTPNDKFKKEKEKGKKKGLEKKSLPPKMGNLTTKTESEYITFRATI